VVGIFYEEALLVQQYGTMFISFIRVLILVFAYLVISCRSVKDSSDL